MEVRKVEGNIMDNKEFSDTLIHQVDSYWPCLVLDLSTMVDRFTGRQT